MFGADLVECKGESFSRNLVVVILPGLFLSDGEVKSDFMNAGSQVYCHREDRY